MLHLVHTSAFRLMTHTVQVFANYKGIQKTHYNLAPGTEYSYIISKNPLKQTEKYSPVTAHHLVPMTWKKNSICETLMNYKTKLHLA